MPLGLVAADYHLEEMAERDGLEGELGRVAALGGDDAEAVAVARSRTSTSSMPTHASSPSWSGMLCAR